jgi:hypothetical protein
VLAQAPGPVEMQIEVVTDGPHDEIPPEIEKIVRSVAGERAALYVHPVRAGQPEIFNVCIRRARGRWVHILHDDDSVEPAFYETLRAGIERAPEIGAAFCRQRLLDDEGVRPPFSLLERETAGIIEGWLDRIGVSCRLQTPSIVVRREAYERLGGYCREAKSAFDWEMWQRLAAHYPVWFEPRPLANFRYSAESESTRLSASGRQVADSRAAIEVARSYLPAAKAKALADRAFEYYAQWALLIAERQIRNGSLDAAMENLREAILCSRSDAVTSRLFSLLSQTGQPEA